MTEIYFEEQKNGYEKEQVDKYIAKLSREYQHAYREYQAVCEDYDKLSLEYKRLENEKQSGADASVIGQIIIDTEMISRQILDEANERAKLIVEQAKADVHRILTKVKDELQAARESITPPPDEAQAAAFNIPAGGKPVLSLINGHGAGISAKSLPDPAFIDKSRAVNLNDFKKLG